MKSEVLMKMHKKIVTNFLDTLILLKLRNSSLGGPDIISYIHKRFHVAISAGTVYSHLYDLEREGLIKGNRENEQRKRIYTLTEKGTKTANTLSGMKDEILGAVSNIFVR